jgi:hypothetical protein
MPSGFIFFLPFLRQEQSGILKRYLCITGEAADFIKVLLTDLSGNGPNSGTRSQKKRHLLVSAGGVKVIQFEHFSVRRVFSPSWRERAL